MPHKRFLSKLIKTLLLLVVLFLFKSCKEDDSEYITNTYVYIELGINTDLANLGVGQVAIIKPDPKDSQGGYIDFLNSNINKVRVGWPINCKGIVLYKKELYVFEAYNITCTYKPQTENCELNFSEPFLPVCACCKSKFMITSLGAPVSGSKAIRNMMPYNASLTYGGSRLVITNY